MSHPWRAGAEIPIAASSLEVIVVPGRSAVSRPPRGRAADLAVVSAVVATSALALAFGSTFGFVSTLAFVFAFGLTSALSFSLTLTSASVSVSTSMPNSSERP